MKKLNGILLICLVSLNFLIIFGTNQTNEPIDHKISESRLGDNANTKILIIYGDHAAGSGGQRHNEFKTYLEGMGYEVDTIHVTSFVLDTSIAAQYHLLIIDRSCTVSHATIAATGRPILALGYGGGLFFTNALGFPGVSTEGTWYDNNHRILNTHQIFTYPNNIGLPPSIIQPVYYGSSWFGDGREYHFLISGLLTGSVALLDYFWDGSERSTRTVLFKYNISNTQKAIFWGYNSYWGIYQNCLTVVGENLLQNIVEYLKVPPEIEIENIQQEPLSPNELDVVNINVTIRSPENITDARIYYTINQSPFYNNSMNLMSGVLTDGVWQGTIVNQSAGTNVSYYIYAENIINDSKKVGPFIYQVNQSKETNPPEIINITRLPIYPTGSDIVQINVSLIDASGISFAKLYYRINDSAAWNITDMSLLYGTTNNGIWNGTIPAFSNGTYIRYYLNISDIFNNSILFPENAPGNYFGYYVGMNDTTPLQIDDITIFPSIPSYNTTITINASVNMSTEVSGLKNLTLCYTINNQNLIYLEMNITGIINYSILNFTAIIPPEFSYGDIIYFNLTSFDLAGNSYSTLTYNLTIIDPYMPELYVSYSPEQPDNSQNVQVQVTTKEIKASGIQNLTLFYSVNETALVNLESPHLVPNIYDFTWNITAPNCSKMELFFDNITLEENFDYLYIYNESYDLIQQYTGKNSNIVITIFGNTSRIRLVTDFGIESWGFSLLLIKFYYYTPQTVPMTLSTGDIYDGNWTAIITKQNNISLVEFYCEAFDWANNSITTLPLKYISSENTFPIIINVTQDPSGAYIRPIYSPEITVQISDDYGIFPNDIILQYSNGGIWTNLTMISQFDTYYTKDGTWNESIPVFAEGTSVDYRIIAQDAARNTIITSNYSYFIDGTAPNLEYYSQSPLEPQYNDTVFLKLTLTDLLLPMNGTGVDTVIMDYYYSNDYVLECSHPYQNNFNDSWIIAHSGAFGIALHFAQITLAAGDIIAIYDGNGQHLQTFLGNITDQWSVRTYTDSIEIRLITNSFGTNYGFLIDQYRVYSNSSLSKISGTIYNGIWSGLISPYPYSTTIWYGITVKDKAGNSNSVLSDSYVVSDKFQPEIISFEISNPNPTPDDDVNITLEVNEQGSGIKNVTLWISLNGGINWLQVPFINSSNIWWITIPRQPDHTTVKYYIEVHDQSGNTLRNPISDYYSIQFSTVTKGLPVWLLILIIQIGIVSAIAFIVFLRTHSKLKSSKEVSKQKISPISIHKGEK